MRKRLIPLMVSLLLALLAAGWVRGWLMGQRKQLQQELAAKEHSLLAQYGNSVDVIAALKDIPENTVLTKDHLGYVTVLEKFVQPYATRKPDDLIGKVTQVPFAQGEQLLLNKVKRPEETRIGSTLSRVTPDGKRAVTIQVDPITGVGGMVFPGDFVDIVWNFQAASPGEREHQLVTVTIFQHVEVLAVDHQLAGQGGDTGGRTSGYTVTLALNPQDAAMLLFAREQGRIQLSLRSTKESTERVAVMPTTMNTLTEAILGKPTKREAPKMVEQPVEVYKGLERSVVAVSKPSE